ncbi:MAG: Lrp/AsnC family transcriptional regulator [Candidatus Nitrosothermus koennekii]|nr:MAG: Lrp/AsnC family transcriptional regulator [Candidatus Nitrosothermus koennekii]
MSKIDELDLKILSELMKDASISVPKLSKKINVNASVIYSRIKRLVKLGLIKKFTIIINDEALGFNVKAVTGINMDAKYRENILKELNKIPEIEEIVEVTGRFDMLVRLHARTLDEMYSIVSDKIGNIEGVQRTETFIEMRRTVKDYELTPQVIKMVQ